MWLAICALRRVRWTVSHFKPHKTNTAVDTRPFSGSIFHAVYSVDFVKKHVRPMRYNSYRILKWQNTTGKIWSMKKNIC